MKTVEVHTSRSYRVVIGSGLLRTVGSEVRRLTKAQTAAVISDRHVWPLYGQPVLESLRAAGLSVVPFLFPPGETSKNADTFLELMNFLAENRLTRGDCLIALGGGVTGDLTGFAAACYLRGVPYIQVPTTVLAAVDSAIGGKTAIDLPAGKNLAGAFYQPSLVLCDTDTLRTLPEAVFRDGCAEIIKYAILYDRALFSYLWENGLNFDAEAVIARCAQWKSTVVTQDEFDTGARAMLNLGHTIGHGIEAKSRFAVSHGSAISIGIAVVSRASGCPDTERILALLKRFGLPTHTAYTADELFPYILSDKKRDGGSVPLILPRAVGACAVVPIKIENLKSFLEAGLSHESDHNAE